MAISTRWGLVPRGLCFAVLPGEENVVLIRDPTLPALGVDVYTRLEELARAARGINVRDRAVSLTCLITKRTVGFSSKGTIPGDDNACRCSARCDVSHYHCERARVSGGAGVRWGGNFGGIDTA